MNAEDERPSGYASPPCMAHELVQGERAFEAVDSQTAIDVGRWRRARRTQLIERRSRMPARMRRQKSEQMISHLDALMEQEQVPGQSTIISVYWPLHAEPNLRSWMQRCHAGGVCIALPEVVARSEPLVFREWRPGCAMRPGIWNIPVPLDSAIMVPTHVIAPLVGYDGAGFRLGHGGGYYDRTLAHMRSTDHQPVAIGVGYACTRLGTIYPQPHDVPMQFIVTEQGFEAFGDR